MSNEQEAPIRDATVSAKALRYVSPFIHSGRQQGLDYLTGVYITPHLKGVLLVGFDPFGGAFYYDEKGVSNGNWLNPGSDWWQKLIKNKSADRVHFIGDQVHVTSSDFDPRATKDSMRPVMWEQSHIPPSNIGYVKYQYILPFYLPQTLEEVENTEYPIGFTASNLSKYLDVARMSRTSSGKVIIYPLSGKESGEDEEGNPTYKNVGMLAVLLPDEPNFFGIFAGLKGLEANPLPEWLPAERTP